MPLNYFIYRTGKQNSEKLGNFPKVAQQIDEQNSMDMLPYICFFFFFWFVQCWESNPGPHVREALYLPLGTQPHLLFCFDYIE
jgi:hypothetical protein